MCIRDRIEDINYFIDRKVDLLIVAPNEAAAVTPVVEKAYGLGIPVVVIAVSYTHLDVYKRQL